jgi:murein DD-endopeptidase MepM/ murein hydrolase activator NlpD
VANLGDVSYGRYVVVDHGDGASSLYAHLSAAWVALGQRVDQGTLIGRVGESGNVTGPHLHLEVHPSGGDPVDPLAWLRARGLRP